MKNGVLLSIVIPTYNEAEGIRTFHKQLLLPALKKATKQPYEIIYVDDGSNDNTRAILTDIAIQDSSTKVIALSRNFGKEIATTAGLFGATGEAIIIMDADGQHPPELIPDFMKLWKAGVQVVIGVRSTDQKEGFVKKWGSKLFYRLFNDTSGVNLVPRSTDFRLIDRAVLEEFKRLGEHSRITRGLIDWLGFRRDFIYFNPPQRLAGEASYKTKRLFILAVNSFVSLSLKPLFYLGVVGVFISIMSFFAGMFVLIEQLLLGDPLGLNLTGTAMLGIFITSLVGLVITTQGVLALYLSHVHTQTQQRPLFVIDRTSSYGLTDTK